jgi:hypothetical protein
MDIKTTGMSTLTILDVGPNDEAKRLLAVLRSYSFQIKTQHPDENKCETNY